MAYQIDPCTTPLAIPERRWAANANVAPTAGGDTRPTVQFTPFSSCIGICARNNTGTQVIGIHLSVRDQNGALFSSGDVATVTGILQNWNYDIDTVIVLGQTSAWEGSVPQAYQDLLAALDDPAVYSFGDGQYGAGLNDGDVLEPTY
ncbi:hypothetical protein SAMN04487939_12459 [Lysobacter sp. yr284]|uniref:hypothetical protein n=1 Tax=Lysobacter TaxID=68 RepID=UPI00089B16AF|nr:hypothetical protein [Lysobacter sp. yr284]SDZ22473.1 hypothetical protein SAMN04487939_12459 [Lysobacter sp. yr284]